VGRFVALLRGVNVGRGNRVPMAEFREILTSLGYEDVRTLLNSGNAVFASSGRSSAAHAAAIGRALDAALGVRVAVVVKSMREFAVIEAGNPFAGLALDHSRLLVAVTSRAEDLPPLGALSALAQPPERFALGRHAAYLWCATGILQSKAALSLLGKAGRSCTTRNWATVLKLGALLRRDEDSPAGP
jgi:uncharacterized protein (DUF1697 family)